MYKYARDYIPGLLALLQGLPLGLCGQPVPLLQLAWPPWPLPQLVVQPLPLHLPAVVLPLLPPLLDEQSLPLLQPAVQLVLLLQLDELPTEDNGNFAKVMSTSWCRGATHQVHHSGCYCSVELLLKAQDKDCLYAVGLSFQARHQLSMTAHKAWRV